MADFALIGKLLLSFSPKAYMVRKENITAAEIPALAELSAPVNAPNAPFSAPFIAPFASKYPNPEIGTVAPAPANSTRY